MARGSWDSPEVHFREDVVEEQSFDESESFDEAPARLATPRPRKLMVEMFEKFVSKTPRGSFQKVLEEWVNAHVEERGHVNPDDEPLAVNSEELTEGFRAELQKAFKKVRTKLREDSKNNIKKKKR